MQNEYTKILAVFAKHFRAATWTHAQALVIGAILARGQRTVTAALRVMGLSDERHFVNYHRVLNRAVWSARALSETLLHVLIQTFAPDQPLLIGGDDTIERRWGPQIKARGIYRDPVRSTHSHFVKTSGLRWLSLMLLVPIPFAQRVWALPFLTILAPSKRYYQNRQRPHKTVTDWMRQGLLQVRRWLPQRSIIFVADSGYAVIDLLYRMTRLPNPITMIVRFRMDAALYEPAPRRSPKTKGRPRLKGKRVPTLAQVAQNPKTRWKRHQLADWYGEARRAIEIVSGTAVWYSSGHPVLPIRWVIVRDPRGRFQTQSLLCTDLTCEPLQIVQWFVRRWQLEVTLRDVREHLGVETQRQWSDQAIARTTPVLLGLYSLITLMAQALAKRERVLVRQTAWYAKTVPTFADALAAVRRSLWRLPTFHVSRTNKDIAKMPNSAFRRFADALSYAA